MTQKLGLVAVIIIASPVAGCAAAAAYRAAAAVKLVFPHALPPDDVQSSARTKKRARAAVPAARSEGGDAGATQWMEDGRRFSTRLR